MNAQGDHHLTSQVSQIVGDITGKEIPHSKAELSDLGIDSMAKLDILTSLEEKFKVVLGESSIEEFVNIDRITRLVQDAILASKNT